MWAVGLSLVRSFFGMPAGRSFDEVESHAWQEDLSGLKPRASLLRRFALGFSIPALQADESDR